MNVRELLNALKNAPPDALIDFYEPNFGGEFSIEAVTFLPSFNSVMLYSDPAEISAGERILHSDIIDPRDEIPEQMERP